MPTAQVGTLRTHSDGTMLECHQSDDRCSIGTAAFRLEFVWIGDRWTHGLLTGPVPPAPGTWQPLVLAVESDPARDGPRRVVSPTFQELHLETGGDAPRALLVGQSGPHHFSAVFTVQERAVGVTIEVEVADRCRAEIDAMASTYQVDRPPGALREATPAQATWDLGDPTANVLVFEGVASAQVGVSEGGRRATRVQAGTVIEPRRATHCWSYRWRYVTGGMS